MIDGLEPEDGDARELLDFILELLAQASDKPETEYRDGFIDSLDLVIDYAEDMGLEVADD